MKRASPPELLDTMPDASIAAASPGEAAALARKVDRRRGRIIYGTVLFVVFVCVALLGMSAWLIARGRAAENEQIAHANTNLARAVGQQVESSLTLAEHIISGIVFELERSDVTPEALQRLQPVLVNHVASVQAIKGLFIYDAQGHWLVHSEAAANTPRNNADREYFIHHRGNPSVRTLISGPIVSRSSGEWVIPVSRRINDPDGNFAGVVLVTLSVKHLRAVLDSFHIGERGAIALFLGDRLLVRRPFRESDMGRRDAGSPLQQRAAAERSGTLEGVSTIDGVKRIISFEHLADYPLLVSVAVGKDEALHDWKSASVYQSIWVGLLCLIIAGAGRYLIRSMRRRLVAEQRLRSTRDALTQANERLAHLADEDGLTGLPNRRYFDGRLVTCFERARARGTALAAVMVDVDEFKKYNDLYGHLAGDECLRRVAHALRSAARRPGDLVARYGGEEMVMLLPDTEAEGARELAERARQAVAELRIAHSASAIGMVTVSLGVAAWVPAPGGTPFELLHAADEALYLAKQEGRNTVRVHGL